MNKGDLNAQEVHTLGRAGAFIATKRLNKNLGRAIYARAVFSRRIGRKKKSSFKDFLLWIDNRRQSLKILGIVKLAIPFLCIYICWFQIKVVI